MKPYGYQPIRSNLTFAWITLKVYAIALLVKRSHKQKEDCMVRGKRKTVTFDAMVKFFMQHYDIPTKKDVEKIHVRLDKLEKLIRSSQSKTGRITRGKTGTKYAAKRGARTPTASDRVHAILKRSKKGLNIAEIKRKTDFDDKKLRNILFRLHSLKRIKRVSRGIYTAAD